MALINEVLPAPETPKSGGDPAGGQSFTDLQAVATEGLGKVQLQHHYPPMRWRLTRASHSEISSETSARPMAMRQRRAAALPARGLNQGIHRRREGARFTGNIGDERDGRAKLP